MCGGGGPGECCQSNGMTAWRLISEYLAWRGGAGAGGGGGGGGGAGLGLLLALLLLLDLPLLVEDLLGLPVADEQHHAGEDQHDAAPRGAVAEAELVHAVSSCKQRAGQTKVELK